LSAAITQWYDGLRTGFAQLRRAFDSRARRERVLLIGAALATVWMLADAFLLSPGLKAWSSARAHRVVAVAAVVHLKEAMALNDGAEEQLRAEVAQWQKRVELGERELLALRATLVGAPEMVQMLDRLLTQVGGLRLRSMRTLDRTEVGTPASAASAGARTASGLYRHGIEMEVEGNYADVLAYLRAIEAMPQRVLWGGMQFKVERSPTVVMSLRLYTVSDDRNWLEI
jgi:MSHA biogenesis protein MshJ